EIPLALSRVLGGALSHLLRNAVAHGIESEAERLELGKPPAGNIRIWSEAGSTGPVIRITDDGRGFDIEALGGRAAPASNGALQAFALALGAGVSTSAHR